MIWFASQEEVDIEMHCLGEEEFKTLNMIFLCLSFFFFKQVYFKRNYPDITQNGQVAMNTSNGQPSALTIFETALWFCHDVKSILKAFFQ